MSLTGLSSDQLLTTAIQYVVDQLVGCGFPVCKATRWHAEPDKLMCCDCSNGNPQYTVVGWINHTYEADGQLREAPASARAVLDATEIGFTVARCWPHSNKVSVDPDARDEVSAKLALVLDCLTVAFSRCAEQPMLFNVVCRAFAKSGFRPRRVVDETPYGQDGSVRYECAGWQFSVTVA